MSFTIKGKIDGLDSLFRSLDGFKAGVRTRVVRKMTEAGSLPILQAARRNAPTRTKNLKKSMGRRTKTYSSGVVVVAIGPRVGFRTQIGVRKRGKRKGEPIYHDPAKIAHLVEYGHAGPTPAPAHPFMRPAFDENVGAARARKEAVGETGIAAEVGRAAR
jgi:HK97 gp10 family phage protein